MASDFLFHPCFALKTCLFCTLGLFLLGVFLCYSLLVPFKFLRKFIFLPSEGFDQYSLAANFLLLKNRMEKEILKKTLKNIKGENFMSLIQLSCLLLLITWVSLLRKGNFPLILVPRIVMLWSSSFVLTYGLRESFNRSCSPELAARNLRVRFAVHL